MSYPCVGCDLPDASECLWLDKSSTPGLRAVWVHKDCETIALQRLGGKDFVPEPRSDVEKKGSQMTLRVSHPDPERVRRDRLERLRVLIESWATRGMG